MHEPVYSAYTTTAGQSPATNLSWRPLGLLLVISVLGAMGCGSRPTIDTRYGTRRLAAESVNGTSVLATMLTNAGHKVSSWRRLSPKLEQDDVLIWIPDSFELPSVNEREFLETWLMNEPERLLVYVGRDYDAAVAYWSYVSEHDDNATASQQIENARQLAKARSEFAERRAEVSDQESPWFSTTQTRPRRSVQTLSGPWSSDIDPRRIDVKLGQRVQLDPKDDHQIRPLLQSEDDLIVGELSKDYWYDSRILVIANGSFLLNGGLVNHENRKLAGQLVREMGSDRHVTLLESDEGGLPILDDDGGGISGFEAFQIWPLGTILLHLTFVGILYCAAVFPIFGRPRGWKTEAPSDFGKHARALGDLLSYAGSSDYAKQRVLQYQELVHARSKTRASQPDSPFRN